MKNIKEILKNVIHKNTTNADNATSVRVSIARPSSKARPHTKTILTILPILILLIATLITITLTNAANSTTEPETDQTFTEEGDGYYIWVRAVDHAGNKGPWSEAQRVWIDASGPSAPTITGGSSEYALSRTISVVTESDDNGASGVAYYEYYKKSGSDKPDTSAAGTKVTTTATSQEFNTNIAGEYVFFRAVDVVGNKGAWSDGQQVCIDINEPTVSAKNSSVTITKGDNVEMSTYFTTNENGNAAISSTTYKIDSTSYSNTSGLAVGTYTVTCTVTKVGGKTASASMTLVVKSALPSSETLLLKSKETGYAYSTTVPAGVEVVKVYYTGSQVGYFSKNSFPNWNSGDIVIYRNTSVYIRVTPGKKYYIRADWEGEGDYRNCLCLLFSNYKFSNS